MHQGEVNLEGVPSSVSAARHFVEEILETAGVGDEIWPAVQVISELATNAVVHAGTPFVVEVQVADSAVRISVTDRRPSVFAAKRRFSAETTTGRGLRLVESLSRSWGVDADDGSKTVWSEIVRVPVGGSRSSDDESATDALADTLVNLVADPGSTIGRPGGLSQLSESSSVTQHHALRGTASRPESLPPQRTPHGRVA